LAAKATDPTASLMSLQLNDWYIARVHGSGDSANQIVLRAAIPFSVGGTNQIFRVTQLYATSIASGVTGPFAQRFFSFAGDSDAPDVRLVNLRPILGQHLGQRRSLSLGHGAIVYDLAKSRWSSLMVSANYGQVVDFWGQKWRPNFELGYDFKNDPGNQRLVARVGITLLLPG
jgi:hypothetical protein